MKKFIAIEKDVVEKGRIYLKTFEDEYIQGGADELDI